MAAWYRDGLRFECTRCGHCCTGTPGYVWVDEAERAALAAHLGLDPAEFGRRYTRLVHGRVSLVERPGGDCVFLDPDGGCTVHATKPRQCVTFPFWPRLLADRRNWQATARDCPGIGQGPLWRADEIEVLLDRTRPKEELWRIAASKRDGS